jgi:hypothetical protein
MFQVDQPTAVTSLPTPAAAGTPGYFTNGNPASGIPATVLEADFTNMVMMELLNVVTASGLTPSKTTYTQVRDSIKSLILGGAGVSPVVGSVRSLSMNVATASATATLTADQIVVASALNGSTYILPSFSKTINLATVGVNSGVGGMDTGTAPVSGFVALYAIYNPTTQASALLAANATSAIAPNVYGGANMPSGYTASALVTVVPTNSSSQFVATFVQDRKVSINQVQILSQGFTAASAVTSLSIAGAVPKNAKRVGGSLSQSTSTAANFVWLFFASTVGIGEQQYSVNTTGGGGNLFAYSGLDLSTAQTLVYQVQTISAGTGTAVLFVSSYEI